jgi:hypothetical protein
MTPDLRGPTDCTQLPKRAADTPRMTMAIVKIQPMSVSLQSAGTDLAIPSCRVSGKLNTLLASLLVQDQCRYRNDRHTVCRCAWAPAPHGFTSSRRSQSSRAREVLSVSRSRRPHAHDVSRSHAHDGRSRRTRWAPECLEHDGMPRRAAVRDVRDAWSLLRWDEPLLDVGIQRTGATRVAGSCTRRATFAASPRRAEVCVIDPRSASRRRNP